MEILSGTSQEIKKNIFSVLRSVLNIFCSAIGRLDPTSKCGPLGHYNNMAASEGDHRVQKSPAAAQRPPHLKALEVFVGRV